MSVRVNQEVLEVASKGLSSAGGNTRVNQEALLVASRGLAAPGGNTRINQLAFLFLVPANLQPQQVQIIGGPFQDALGNPLANGYLIFQLQHDAVALNSGQIMGNMSVKVPLDGAGRIQGTVSGLPVLIWPNAALLPAGGNYIIWAYDVSGKLAWDNPQIQVVGNTNPFNVNTWVPGP